MTLTLGPAWAIAAATLNPKPNPYATDPVGWVRDKTGEHLWSKQREIYEALVKHRKVAVKAGHGVGKSMSASRLGAWWVDTHPTNDTWLITTAPTDEQVKAIFWQELTFAHEKAGLAGRITGDAKWRVGTTIVGQGRKPSDYNASAFQGIHRKYVLVIIDEACGVKPSLYEGASNIVTGDECRTLAIGNPDDPSSTFYDITKGAPDDGSSGLSDAGWWVITISVFDNPRFTGEPVPTDLFDAMPGERYVNEKRLELGEDSPLWQSKVLGRFPKNSSDGIIPYTWLRTCCYPRTYAQNDEKLRGTELGLDVGASSGGDWTVLYERNGIRLGRRWAWREADHMVLAPKILQVIQETKATRLKGDATGAGHGLLDILADYGRRGLHAATVDKVNFGGGATNPARFANVRAELHWNLRELVQAQAIDLSVLTDSVISELTATKQLPDASRIKCEPKEDVHKRLKRSPDDADAVLLTYYSPPKLGGVVSYEEW